GPTGCGVRRARTRCGTTTPDAGGAGRSGRVRSGRNPLPYLPFWVVFRLGHGLPTAETPELCCARNPTPHTDASFQRGGGRPTRERVLSELSRGGGVHRCRPADGRRHARRGASPPTAATRRGQAPALRSGFR